MDKATLQTQLVEARQARHNLAIGSLREQVRMQDRTVTFTAASMDRLDAYIRSLESQLGISTNRRRAVGVQFG